MSSKQVLAFFGFMIERHGIYLRRRAGLPRAKWTKDPILREYRFCNVYRELDTVTIWIRENIREPYAKHNLLWFMLCIARRINWPPTLKELMRAGAWPAQRWDPALLMKVLDERTKRGEQVYTGAYMITAETGPEHTGKTKSRTTAYSNLDAVYRQAGEIEPLLYDTLHKAYSALLGKGFAWGPFMTYEVVTDLRHTRYLEGAMDIYSWANAGPGALRGLNRIIGNDPNMPIQPGRANQLMRELLIESGRRWPNNKDYPKLEMRDIEHSLCEFDKYERARLGQGRPRSKFKPKET